jgi:hypothetical protein
MFWHAFLSSQTQRFDLSSELSRCSVYFLVTQAEVRQEVMSL